MELTSKQRAQLRGMAAGIDTIQLAAKEGLALINGTQIMTAIGCFVVDGAVKLMKTADGTPAETEYERDDV